MAANQANLTETIAQIAAEAARVVVQAMAMTSVENNQGTQNARLKLGGPLMTQPTLYWSSTDKYAELRNFT